MKGIEKLSWQTFKPLCCYVIDVNCRWLNELRYLQVENVVKKAFIAGEGLLLNIHRLKCKTGMIKNKLIIQIFQTFSIIRPLLDNPSNKSSYFFKISMAIQNSNNNTPYYLLGTKEDKVNTPYLLGTEDVVFCITAVDWPTFPP